MTARAVLIDPVARSVTNVEFDGTWQGLMALMGLPPDAQSRVDVDTLVRNHSTGDTLHVRTRRNHSADRWVFSPNGAQSLGGRGVITGARDAGGKFASAVVPLERVQRQVTFVRRDA